MLFTHRSTLSKGAQAGLRLVAGLVLIGGLLLAMAMVAGGEVRKAQTRDARLAAQQAAVSHCIETLRGRALNSCVQQVRAGAGAAPATTEVTATAMAEGSAAARDGASLPGGRSDLMSIAFDAPAQRVAKN